MLSGCAAAGGFEPPLLGAVETGGCRVANLATRWHEVPSPPLEGEVPNEREAEGFVRQQSVNPSASLRSAAPLSGEPRRLRR